MNQKMHIGQIAAAALSSITLLTASCSSDTTESGGERAPAQGERVGSSHTHLLPVRRDARPAIMDGAAPADATLTYYGGPVIPHVKVWTVFWGSSVPSQSELNAFYSTITDSAYFDWLTEYDTDAQHIGRGSLGGSVVDTGAPAGATITDAQIQAEITRLIDAGELPANDADNVYMVHFPAGVTIESGEDTSCVQFCAYHGTFSRRGTYAYYGVIPDLSGGCDSGCGSGSKFDNTTAVSSHELIEAVTDAAVGEATSNGPPLAWYDETYGEIGDICNAQQAKVAGYTVQKEFSNRLKRCVATADGGGCAHSICATGGKLTASCDACAAKVCAEDAYCCKTKWDDTCVGEVSSLCNQTCN